MSLRRFATHIAAMLVACFIVSLAHSEVVFGPVWDLKPVVTAAQKYANQHRVNVVVWKLPKEAKRPQRWIAVTTEVPDKATVETTIRPR